MPQLLIPLINKVFHTSYSEEEKLEKLRNKHYEKYRTVLVRGLDYPDSWKHIYHLECQSSKDRTMVIRMLVRHFDCTWNIPLFGDRDFWEIAFPQYVPCFISAITGRFQIIVRQS